ncbi:hypothetical protein GS18_0216225 [Metabacillus indicus]|uniref:Lipoprotein YvcA n=1 Tax=Metabacillus indicus TaxID=246786 RepID=A0A084GNP9_METID|nr:hypothetical protein GS18_0216225 [Metabacillus indicus]
MFLTTMLAFTGGCGMTKEKDKGKVEQQSMPETEAFKDEFTREFMKSAKEIEDGYYLFESKTQGYTMKFPVGATTDQSFYEIEGEHFENIIFGADDEEENTTYSIINTYENQPVTEKVEANLSLISDSVNYEGNYNKKEFDDKTIYFASKINDSKNGNTSFYEVFGYVKSQNSNQAVSFTNAVSCLRTDKECNLDLTEEQIKTLDLMESITFLN